jgi:hypothetical protein
MTVSVCLCLARRFSRNTVRPLWFPVWPGIYKYATRPFRFFLAISYLFIQACKIWFCGDDVLFPFPKPWTFTVHVRLVGSLLSLQLLPGRTKLPTWSSHTRLVWASCHDTAQSAAFLNGSSSCFPSLYKCFLFNQNLQPVLVCLGFCTKSLHQLCVWDFILSFSLPKNHDTMAHALPTSATRTLSALCHSIFLLFS